MPTPALTVKQVPLGTLALHPRNPRSGKVDVIADSLQVNGQFRPLIVSSDGYVLGGNHTLRAMQKLGWKTASVVQLPVSHDSPQATRIMLADNRTSDLGTYDDVLLRELLQTLSDADDLLGTGYETADLDDLVALLEETGDPAPLDNVERLPTMAEKLDKYQEMGRRMIVLDYDQETYVEVTELLEAERQRQGVESNAEAVLGLLRTRRLVSVP